ncbi:hypothetical protein EGO53_28385 (plasmid) [Serratia liquefaciens]|uniref:Uncharacterized protein n=1 Tax=Serratia liquefaciens TaxID=614 RepID=A0A515D5N1_SERLI|nr:hypothetical protein EGO53_28385 [Serratia liquefaciens]
MLSPYGGENPFLAIAQELATPARDEAGTAAEAACASDWNNVEGVRTGKAAGGSEYLPQTKARLC